MTDDDILVDTAKKLLAEQPTIDDRLDKIEQQLQSILTYLAMLDRRLSMRNNDYEILWTTKGDTSSANT